MKTEKKQNKTFKVILTAEIESVIAAPSKAEATAIAAKELARKDTLIPWRVKALEKLQTPLYRLRIEWDDTEYDHGDGTPEQLAESRYLVDLYGVYGFIFEVAEYLDADGEPIFEDRDSCWSFGGYKPSELKNAMFEHISLPDGVSRSDVEILWCA